MDLHKLEIYDNAVVLDGQPLTVAFDGIRAIPNEYGEFGYSPINKVEVTLLVDELAMSRYKYDYQRDSSTPIYDALSEEMGVSA